MVAPEMPTGGLIGQAVLNDEPNGNGNDAMRVVPFGQRVVGCVRVEELLALGALVLRVDQMDVVRPTRQQMAKVVQHARESPVAETGFPTARANTLPEVTAASEYLGLRQIFLAGDAFRGIRQILSWSRHGKALLGHAFLAQNLRHLPVGVVVSFHVMMLETRLVS